ncbi:luciferin 4-monooxygenase-like [Manduca sexta]|uniref:luciferin 4-monooxygenase-like n=1 Tax=Manduca sexta TaxID=7130 RepID=UPI00188DF1E8|nr:luciferin 4-monooxygenase-like [Manduca sexta]
MTGFRGSNIPKTSHANDAVHWYLSDLTHRVVEKSGISNDRYHLGKIILQSLKDDPQLLSQIDGGTGESETFRSVLKRSVQCANGLRKLGLKTGDVMILMAPNHLDLAIPFYAALYLGITIAPIDRLLRVSELEDVFHVDNPKIIFCQNERLSDVLEASKNSVVKPEVITFDNGDQVLSFADFLESYGNDVSIEDFRASDFAPSTTIALLINTSGTTGKPKSAAVTHRSFAISMPCIWERFTTFPNPTKLVVILSPLQWLTAITIFLASAVLKFARLQSSLPVTQQHAYFLFNKYRPSFIISSPTMMTTLIKSDDRETCDFSCFETILIGGSAVSKTLIEEVKKLVPKADVFSAYGMSECTTMIFQHGNTPPGSCGMPSGSFQYRLVDPLTGEDIHEPNVPGELRLQSPVLFAGYFNNPEATAETMEDGWLKTGDLFYRDENWNFFFVDRLKQLLKYKSHQISPVEVEDVIRQHPSVLDVAVVGIPDPECGDLPVACVVPKPGHTIVPQQIKDLVKNTLADSKQLRGGVVVMSELPLTATTKLHRQKLNQMVLTANRE